MSKGDPSASAPFRPQLGRGDYMQIRLALAAWAAAQLGVAHPAGAHAYRSEAGYSNATLNDDECESCRWIVTLRKRHS